MINYRLKDQFVISVCGKGGVGKSTIITLIAIILSEYEDQILLVDADPNLNLGELLGIKVDQSIGNIIDNTILDVRDKSENYEGAVLLEYRIWDSIQSIKNINLLSMGYTSQNMCYCAINSIIIKIIDFLKSTYNLILIDMPAGLEHFSRRTDRDVDIMILITDKSKMGMKTIERILELSQEVNISFKKIILIGNKINNEYKFLDDFCQKKGIIFGGILPYDQKIAEFNLEGKKLLDIPNESKLVKELKKIIINKFDIFI
ncbi:MAG: nucleotide-binding protein [Candidatus Helarchaeota archaeon]